MATTSAQQIQADIDKREKKRKRLMINAILYCLGKALPLLVTFNKEKKREQQHNATKAMPRHPSLHPGTVVRSGLVLNEPFAGIVLR